MAPLRLNNGFIQPIGQNQLVCIGIQQLIAILIMLIFHIITYQYVLFTCIGAKINAKQKVKKRQMATTNKNI